MGALFLQVGCCPGRPERNRQRPSGPASLGPVTIEVDAENTDAAARTVTVQGAVAVLEGRHQVSIRLDDSGELGERACPGARRKEDQRKPAHHPGQRRVLERQLAQVGDLVHEAR
jgi:hypothetical protein